MGWMFEEIDRIINNNPLFPSEKGFYGIILDTVITESCKQTYLPAIKRFYFLSFLFLDADSLLMLDKVLRN